MRTFAPLTETTAVSACHQLTPFEANGRCTKSAPALRKSVYQPYESRFEAETVILSLYRWAIPLRTNLGELEPPAVSDPLMGPCPRGATAQKGAARAVQSAEGT